MLIDDTHRQSETCRPLTTTRTAQYGEIRIKNMAIIMTDNRTAIWLMIISALQLSLLLEKLLRLLWHKHVFLHLNNMICSTTPFSSPKGNKVIHMSSFRIWLHNEVRVQLFHATQTQNIYTVTYVRTYMNMWIAIVCAAVMSASYFLDTNTFMLILADHSQTWRSVASRSRVVPFGRLNDCQKWFCVITLIFYISRRSMGGWLKGNWYLHHHLFVSKLQRRWMFFLFWGQMIKIWPN